MSSFQLVETRLVFCIHGPGLYDFVKYIVSQILYEMVSTGSHLVDNKDSPVPQTQVLQTKFEWNGFQSECNCMQMILLQLGTLLH